MIVKGKSRYLVELMKRNKIDRENQYEQKRYVQLRKVQIKEAEIGSLEQQLRDNISEQEAYVPSPPKTRMNLREKHDRMVAASNLSALLGDYDILCSSIDDKKRELGALIVALHNIHKRG